MPKLAKELTALEVKRLTYQSLMDEKREKAENEGRKPPTENGLPIFKAVGGVPGLHLQLTATGGRSWVYRYAVRIPGTDPVKYKRRALGLGSYPTYGVAEARDRAREAVRMIDEGEDPIKKNRERRDQLAAAVAKPTFAQAVEGWLKDNPHEFTSAGYRKSWINSITAEKELKGLQDRYVDQIEDRLIWSMLKKVAKRSPDLASRMQRRIVTVLNWALGERHMKGENPADTVWLKNKIKAEMKGVKKGHQPALQIEDAARWMADLRERDGMGSRALEFLALTAVRSGNVRGAVWDEIDLEKAVWTIPASRMKMKRDHTVPLPEAAVALLRSLPRFEGNPLVFPAQRGGQMSDMTLSATMKRMHESDVKAGGPGYLDLESGKPAVPHGLRACFRMWAGEAGLSREHAEIALAHKFGDATEQAYQRSIYTEQRRPMMEAWGKFLSGEQQTTVVALHG
jgi:integrase